MPDLDYTRKLERERQRYQTNGSAIRARVGERYQRLRARGLCGQCGEPTGLKGKTKHYAYCRRCVQRFLIRRATRELQEAGQ